MAEDGSQGDGAGGGAADDGHPMGSRPSEPIPPRSLADALALQRTQLANERTFLAYARTALASIVAGLSLVQFFAWRWAIILGWALMPIGLVTIIIGLTSYVRAARRMGRIPSE